MKKFDTLSSITLPLNRANVDTDAIIPKQFLKSIKRTGFGENLFDEWRYLDHGEISMDNKKRPLNMSFVLNNPKYKGAKILLARENFGCGSSREHAVWALLDYGFCAVIALSFADIFYNNCFKNGLLPVVQSPEVIDKLFAFDKPICLDLSVQTIRMDKHLYHFEINPGIKQHLLEGLDDIALTLKFKKRIVAFEKKHLERHPWL